MNFRTEESPLDLSGAWSFAHTPVLPDPLPRTSADLVRLGLTPRPCTVPGNFETDLMATGEIPDPLVGMNSLLLRPYESYHIWYFRRFKSGEKPGLEAELVFHGLDCLADIYLNGEHLGSSDNMLVEQVFSTRGKLKAENELLVHLRPAVVEAKRYPKDPNTWTQPWDRDGLHIRKAPHMYGWDIMPRAVSAGIWRPAELRYLGPERLESVFLMTDQVSADQRQAQLTLRYEARLGD